MVVTQLTDNDYDDTGPHISGSKIVWMGKVDGPDNEICFYDGSTITRLTDNSDYDSGSCISGSNVVWHGLDGSDSEIFLYDGSTITQLTDNNYGDSSPHISGSNVVWNSFVDDRDWEIMLYNGSTITQLTDNSQHDFAPKVSGSNVVWVGNDGSDNEIFLFDGSTITQLTNNSYNDKMPHVSGSNVVWTGFDGSDNEIFFYDGTTITQLSDNSYNDRYPQISGSNVVWYGHDGYDSEIYLAVMEPAIIYVDDDAPAGGNGRTWETAYKYLQDALSAAQSGDKICVAEGTYKPDQGTGVTAGDRQATFQLINGVTIKGGYAGFGEPDPNARDIQLYKTILNGDLDGNDIDVNYPWGLWNEPTRTENSYHVVTGSGTDPNTILDGFTITAGNANCLWDDYYNACGAGLNVMSSNLKVVNCNFRSNTASIEGGGMYNYDSNPTVTNCTFTENRTQALYTSTKGGGMYNYQSNAILTNCTFSDNSADLGGAICNYECGPTIIDCTFSENKGGAGGGMANYVGSPTVTNCTFRGNSAHGTGVSTAGGGGMSNYDSSPKLTNCTFSGNYGNGGGMENYRSSPKLTNCIFASNYVSGMVNHESSVILNNCTFSTNHADNPWGMGAGGAMYNWGSDLTLTNCTFSQNSANMGDALACYSYEQRWPSNLELTNCILWDGGDEIWNYDNSIIKITYCNIHGGWPGKGNIDSVPLFVGLGYWANPNDPNIVGDPNDPNAIWIDGDYHLLPGSPCIDTGDPNYIAEPNETDLDGNSRVIGCRIDMGAYEYEYGQLIPSEARIVPRTINLASKGNWITCYISLPEGYDVADIDPNSVLLEDEIKPNKFSVDEQQQVAIARFTREDAQIIITVGQIELSITGRLADGTGFEGNDIIMVIDKGDQK
jgi:hypothetical protein